MLAAEGGADAVTIIAADGGTEVVATDLAADGTTNVSGDLMDSQGENLGRASQVNLENPWDFLEDLDADVDPNGSRISDITTSSDDFSRSSMDVGDGDTLPEEGEVEGEEGEGNLLEETKNAAGNGAKKGFLQFVEDSFTWAFANPGTAISSAAGTATTILYTLGIEPKNKNSITDANLLYSLKNRNNDDDKTVAVSLYLKVRSKNVNGPRFFYSVQYAPFNSKDLTQNSLYNASNEVYTNALNDLYTQNLQFQYSVGFRFHRPTCGIRLGILKPGTEIATGKKVDIVRMRAAFINIKNRSQKIETTLAKKYNPIDSYYAVRRQNYNRNIRNMFVNNNISYNDLTFRCEYLYLSVYDKNDNLSYSCSGSGSATIDTSKGWDSDFYEGRNNARKAAMLATLQDAFNPKP